MHGLVVPVHRKSSWQTPVKFFDRFIFYPSEKRRCSRQDIWLMPQKIVLLAQLVCWEKNSSLTLKLPCNFLSTVLFHAWQKICTGQTSLTEDKSASCWGILNMTDHYVLTQINSLITGRPKSLAIVKPVVTTSKSCQISEQKYFKS